MNSHKKLYIARKAAGLCVRCGERSPLSGRIDCEQCARDPESWRQIRAKRKTQGTCMSCGQRPPEPGKVRCTSCAQNQRTRHQIMYDRRKDADLCIKCGAKSLPNSVHCEKHIRKRHEYSAAVRNTVLEHYGKVCSCCGERNTKFLTIDHMNNDGYVQRRLDKSKRAGSYGWIIKSGFPTDLQVLCFNCNSGKALNGGVCPHKQTSDDDIPMRKHDLIIQQTQFKKSCQV